MKSDGEIVGDVPTEKITYASTIVGTQQHKLEKNEIDCNDLPLEATSKVLTYLYFNNMMRISRVAKL